MSLRSVEETQVATKSSGGKVRARICISGSLEKFRRKKVLSQLGRISVDTMVSRDILPSIQLGNGPELIE